MRWNKKFEYPKSIRSTENGIRKYLIGDKKLPSVTSILDATKSEEDKAALANWRERTGEKEAQAITQAAANRGSKMHAYLETYLLGRENMTFFDDNEKHKIMAKQIIEKGLKNRFEEIWGVECTLFKENSYSGTCDAVGIFDGKEAIIDFKQSNKPKKSEYIDSWLLQTAAYSLAHNSVYNSNITSCVILVCTVDNLFQEFKIQNHDLVVYQNLFLGRLKKFNELSNLA
tara:strand:- start:13 stop:699 length:687 start_codon:yes stop_codon:yes gene_type:complete